MNNFSRESKDRTRAERVIDRHLVVRDEPPRPVKKAKVSEVIPEVNVKGFIEKIKKHLAKQQQLKKSISVLSKFIQTYFAKISGSEVYSCLSTIFSHDLSVVFPSPGLVKIFEFFKDSDFIYLDEEKSEISHWEFVSLTFNKMHTDDSVLFHTLVKEIDEILENFSGASSKSLWYGKGLVTLKKYLQTPWSRAATMALLRKCYRKIEIFDLETQKSILEMLDSQQHSGVSGTVKDILISNHEVNDSRIEVKSVNSLDMWAGKQSGGNN